MRCAPPKRRRIVCPPKRGLVTANSFAEVVRHYCANYRENASDDLAFYAEQPSLSKAVELAALSKTCDGKRQSHQRRLSASTLRRAHAELDQCNLKACRSFDALFRTVDEAIGGIHGIGALTVYDIACRIGAYLKLKPKRIYLHAGTRTGARAIGLGDGVDALEIDELPPAFRCLTASEIEDCLCIYKDELRQLARRSRK
jgi:hypothetical protein